MPPFEKYSTTMEVGGIMLQVHYTIADEKVHLQSIRHEGKNIALIVAPELIEEITAKLEHQYGAATA